MKKNTYGVGVLVLVAVLVVGVLHGWFRDRQSVPADQLAALEATERNQRSATGAPERFRTLWMDHVSLTRAVIVAEFSAAADLDATVAALLQNQKDIALAVDTYYPGSYQPVADLLTEHIVVAKDILDDLRDLRLARLPGDINAWYDNADRFAQAMQAINPAWDLRGHMHAHLRMTEREAIYEWLGLSGASQGIYEKKIAPQSQEIAEMISAEL